MGKIFVRERRDVGEGAGRPRFAIVATAGTDLKVFRPRIRKSELEKIASETGAEIVYLPRGQGGEGGGPGRGRQRGRRHQRDT
jgi:hypothetical protein